MSTRGTLHTIVVATDFSENAGVALAWAQDTVTCEADPPPAILDHAKSVGADLIAMGTQGLSGLNRLLLGSTAERVVASAPCPVLTVRRESA